MPSVLLIVLDQECFSFVSLKSQGRNQALELVFYGLCGQGISRILTHSVLVVKHLKVAHLCLALPHASRAAHQAVLLGLARFVRLVMPLEEKLQLSEELWKGNLLLLLR